MPASSEKVVRAFFNLNAKGPKKANSIFWDDHGALYSYSRNWPLCVKLNDDGDYAVNDSRISRTTLRHQRLAVQLVPRRYFWLPLDAMTEAKDVREIDGCTVFTWRNSRYIYMRENHACVRQDGYYEQDGYYRGGLGKKTVNHALEVLIKDFPYSAEALEHNPNNSSLEKGQVVTVGGPVGTNSVWIAGRSGPTWFIALRKLKRVS